jgi:hypothetical protein
MSAPQTPAHATPTVFGNIDSVNSEGVVSGWCWSPDEPDRHRVVAISVDGVDTTETIAADARADLAAVGYGDGFHGFTVRLERGDFGAGQQSAIKLRDVATGQIIGAGITFTWPDLPEASPALVGNIEGASEDGWVSGWAWTPTEPDRRLTLDILVDGIAVGSTRATTYRPDLEQAGVGDGHYGFAFPLPWSILSSKGEMSLSIRETSSGEDFGEPFVLRIGRLIDVEERINGLERHVRLMHARLVEQDEAADAHRHDKAARELFRTVAAFFQDLAERPEAARQGGAALRNAVGTVLESHPPIVLEIPDRPHATLLLLGDGPLAAIHACLAILQEDRLDNVVDIVLIDDQRHGADIALLPAMVRNLRYARSGHGRDAATARNELIADARTDLVVVMSSHVRPARDAVGLLVRTFSEAPTAAIVGALIKRDDGSVEHAGLRMTGPSDLAEIDLGAEPASATLRNVDAVADLLYGLRRDMLIEAGGFPAGYDEPGKALAGLCLSLRALGHGVMLQPRATGRLTAGGLRDRGGSPLDRRRIRDRLRGFPAPSPDGGEGA